MSDEKDFGYRVESKSSEAQVAHRQILYDLFRDRPMPDEQLMIVLGLYMRSSALAKSSSRIPAKGWRAVLVSNGLPTEID